MQLFQSATIDALCCTGYYTPGESVMDPERMQSESFQSAQSERARRSFRAQLHESLNSYASVSSDVSSQCPACLMPGISA